MCVRVIFNVAILERSQRPKCRTFSIFQPSIADLNRNTLHLSLSTFFFLRNPLPVLNVTFRLLVAVAVDFALLTLSKLINHSLIA